MSHFNVCVLVKPDGSDLRRLEHKAETMLANFDINKEVDPYKKYVDKDDIRQMAKSYKIGLNDFSTLAEKLKEWSGDTGGVDEGGLYGISTKNPNGHIDAWGISTQIKPEDRGALLFGEGDEKICHAVVTPDGIWHSESPWVYGSPNADEEKELAIWTKKMSTLLNEYKDAVAFLADCHI